MLIEENTERLDRFKNASRLFGNNDVHDLISIMKILEGMLNSGKSIDISLKGSLDQFDKESIQEFLNDQKNLKGIPKDLVQKIAKYLEGNEPSNEDER